MNKKQIIIQAIISLAISLLVLLTCFLSTYFISENEAKANITNYASSIANIYKNEEDNEELLLKYDEVLNLRITILKNDSNIVILDINNIDNSITSEENRLSEFLNNIDKFYYKSSLTLDSEVLYYVTENKEGYLIRVGQLRSDIISSSINVLIIGSIFIVIINIIYYIYLYFLYKRNFKMLKNEVNKLSDLVTTDPFLYGRDGFDVLSTLIDDTRVMIINNLNNLTLEKEKIEYIINVLEEGIIVLNNKKEVILINDFSLKILETKKENVINKSYKFMLFPLSFEDKIKELEENENLNHVELVIKINSKDYAFVFSKVKNDLTFKNTPVDDEFIYTILINDITYINETIEMKKEFFQNSSHELKSPLTSIIAYSEMIKNGLLNSKEEIKEANDHILNSSKRMKELIQNMLYLSSLENNVIKKDKRIININELIKRIVEENKIKIENKNIEVKIEKYDDLALIIEENDANILFRNLILNAINYVLNNEGKIIIYIYKDKLIVKDNGIGIKKEDIPNIFTRFKRSGEAIKINSEGTGLGLAIVKHVLIKYNFKIEVNSEINKGSEFIVTFDKSSILAK